MIFFTHDFFKREIKTWIYCCNLFVCNFLILYQDVQLSLHRKLSKIKMENSICLFVWWKAELQLITDKKNKILVFNFVIYVNYFVIYMETLRNFEFVFFDLFYSLLVYGTEQTVPRDMGFKMYYKFIYIFDTQKTN